MFELDQSQLTEEQRDMVQLWEDHVKAEFEDKDSIASCGTMVDEPYVNHVPTLAGGKGREHLEYFYANYFIPRNPPDVETELISRTVGQDRFVDEFVFRCTHSRQIDWLLPGVPPTNRRLELVLVVIISFENGKMKEEHIYWDQASALVQVGLLDPSQLPVVGAEAAHKMLDPDSVPSNGLIKRYVDDDKL
ncbi:SnoaL-like polyketide cyclase [Thalassoglobus neptunius]|uniref:SnoaL-like polyketide cyclase n=1 Tax=Thalassoglobus neptunius TaxID=1938619 RepID=A0A5C5X3J0_9PLAN|nr:ester cyclase [Thalassoglobus neptunius]TWT57368.1 SnoaL-like polyketide cyclase [Thalassoglobus neptunius]